jgi:NitT/TauT family transport system substrate-binding protein
MTYARLNLDFYHPWANNAGYYVARERGYYREVDIDLDITAYDPFREDSLHRLAAGEIDVACNYPQRLMKHTEDGDELLSVAAVNTTTFESLIYDRRKPVDKLLDLEGRRVATPRSPRVRQVLRRVMEEHAADPAAVEFVEYYPGEPDPLEIETGAFDAVWGSYWGWEGILSRRANEHITWYTAPELGAPSIHNQILAVTRERAEGDGAFVRAFLRATARGFRDAAADPGRAAEVMVMVAPTFSRAQFAAAIAACAPTWGLDAWGGHDLDLIRPYAQWLTGEGFLSWTKGHDGEFTDAFLPAPAELGGGTDG